MDLPCFLCILCFYEYLVGIRTIRDNPEETIQISPVLLNGIDRLKGERQFSDGKVSVEYQITQAKVQFRIHIPSERKGIFLWSPQC